MTQDFFWTKRGEIRGAGRRGFRILFVWPAGGRKVSFLRVWGS